MCALHVYLQIIREKIYQRKDVLTKSCDVDLVTEWDQEVEKLLIGGISARYPDHRQVESNCTQYRYSW